MSQLRAEKLKKRYKARTVVKDVSLDVSSGEVVGLLGPNGAGKTTCFYMMVGLVALDGGELFLPGGCGHGDALRELAWFGMRPDGISARGMIAPG